MKPYYNKNGIQIFLGDCRKVLQQIGSVDCVLTDPPFGISFDRATWTDSPEQYEAFMLSVISLCEKLCPTGVKAFWQALPNCTKWHRWFSPHDYRIFSACKGFVQFRPTAVQWSWDPIVWWGDCPGKPDTRRKDYFVQKLAPFGANRLKIEHPSAKPMELTQYLISIFTLEGQLLCDPFMGSGTTLVAAKKLGRKAIGIELEEKYCKVAIARLDHSEETRRHKQFSGLF